MTDGIRRPFNYRAFWSLLLAVTGLGLPWTGVELHAAGHGPPTAAGHAWMAAHWVFAVLFTVAVLGHVVMNGRALLRYFRGLALRVVPLSREALIALGVTAALLLVAVGHTRLDGDHGVDGQERALDADRD